MTFGVFDGLGPLVSQPDDPVGMSLTVTRAAPVPGLTQVCAALLCETLVPVDAVSLEWNAVFRLDNYASAGENTGLTVLANQWGSGPTWGMQVVAENRTANDASILYGIELDLCSAGTDPTNQRQALAIFFGDAYPNTFNPVGAPVRSYAGISINPFAGMDRASLGYGLEMGGNISEGIGIASSGLTAFSAYGNYSTAVLNTAGATADWALSMGPGQSLKYASGGANPAWYSGAFTPFWVGAIRFRVDGTDLYLPVCNNHP